MDRVHRIGQIYPVIVTRFIMQGTVEEKMLELQACARPRASTIRRAQRDV